MFFSKKSIISPEKRFINPDNLLRSCTVIEDALLKVFQLAPKQNPSLLLSHMVEEQIKNKNTVEKLLHELQTTFLESIELDANDTARMKEVFADVFSIFTYSPLAMMITSEDDPTYSRTCCYRKIKSLFQHIRSAIQYIRDNEDIKESCLFAYRHQILPQLQTVKN